jgi:hypothetical protein
LCALEKKPYVLVDARQVPEAARAAEVILEFVEEHGIQVLNVAVLEQVAGRKGMRMRWLRWGQ